MALSESSQERRRSGRYRQDLVVEIVDRHGSHPARAIDVARHGLLLETEEALRERHIVQLTIYLPSGGIQATATVARRVHADAPGVLVGVELFAMSEDAKRRWDGFMQTITQRTPTAPTESSDPSVPLGEGREATFLVRLKTVDRLKTFQKEQLEMGGTVLFTPVLREPGEVVSLVVVHPETEEEFRLPGTVVAAHRDRPKRLEIRFSGINAAATLSFQNFVETGRAPQHVLPEPPSFASPSNWELPLDTSGDNPPAPGPSDERIAEQLMILDESSTYPPIDTVELSGFSVSVPRADTGPPVVAPPTAVSYDAGFHPQTYLLRCSHLQQGCRVEPYAVDVGPCRGVQGLVADLVPFVSELSGRIVSVPQMAASKDRQARVQAFLAKGGQLAAPIDVWTLLDVAGFADEPREVDSEAPLKQGKTIERLLRAMAHIETSGVPAMTKIRCNGCGVGHIVVERVTT